MDCLAVRLAPTNIFCIGLNYRRHAQESNLPIPQYPVIFMKPTTAAIGPGEPIMVPACCDAEGEVDYESELAVVIELEKIGRLVNPVVAANR